jgi:mRNA-degrading endonuclease toxin of MazEF toxin-antitoxin module
MRQFDVCVLRRSGSELVVLLQHDDLDELATRVVAPLSSEASRGVIDRVRVPVRFEGRDMLLHLDRLAAVRASEIGLRMGSLASEQHRIKNGLDLLFLGV